MSEIEHINVEQGSEEWHAARRGIPTASMFKTVMASGRGSDTESKTRAKYLRQLAGEIITGKALESYTNERMNKGKEIEPDLANHFSLLSGLDIETCGFFRRGRMGASPDRLIVGKDATLEIKSAEPHVLIAIFEKGIVPPEHIPQVQGNLYCTGRAQAHLAIGWPGMPMFRKIIPADPLYQQKLRDAIDAFNRELDSIVAMMRKFGA